MAFFEVLAKIQRAPRRTRKAILGIATAVFILLLSGVWWLEWKNLEGAINYSAAKSEIMGPLEMLWGNIKPINDK